jgi:hypothetical protein
MKGWLDKYNDDIPIAQEGLKQDKTLNAEQKEGLEKIKGLSKEEQLRWLNKNIGWVKKIPGVEGLLKRALGNYMSKSIGNSYTPIENIDINEVVNDTTTPSFYNGSMRRSLVDMFSKQDSTGFKEVPSTIYNKFEVPLNYDPQKDHPGLKNYYMSSSDYNPLDTVDYKVIKPILMQIIAKRRGYKPDMDFLRPDEGGLGFKKETYDKLSNIADSIAINKGYGVTSLPSGEQLGVQDNIAEAAFNVDFRKNPPQFSMYDEWDFDRNYVKKWRPIYDKSNMTKEQTGIANQLGKPFGLMLPLYIKNYPKKANGGIIGDGYTTEGRNYSPAWGGQFKNGGEITNVFNVGDDIAQNGVRKLSTPYYEPLKINNSVRQENAIYRKPIYNVKDTPLNEDLDWYDQYFEKRVPIAANNIYNPTNDPNFNPSKEEWEEMQANTKQYLKNRVEDYRNTGKVTWIGNWDKEATSRGGRYLTDYKLTILAHDKNQQTLAPLDSTNTREAYPQLVAPHEIGHAISSVDRTKDDLDRSDFDKFELSSAIDNFNKNYYKKPERPSIDRNSFAYKILSEKGKEQYEKRHNFPKWEERSEEQLSSVWGAKRMAEKIGMVKDAATHDWTVDDIKKLRNYGFLKYFPGYTDKDLQKFFQTIVENKSTKSNQYKIPTAQNGRELQYYQQGNDWQPKSISRDGSIIHDNNGYWNRDNWGKPVQIDSNRITMEGVSQPLLGIGLNASQEPVDAKMMTSGNNYRFKGKKVVELPIGQNGANVQMKDQEVLLDNLINFTNLNKKMQDGGILNPKTGEKFNIQGENDNPQFRTDDRNWLERVSNKIYSEYQEHKPQLFKDFPITDMIEPTVSYLTGHSDPETGGISVFPFMGQLDKKLVDITANGIKNKLSKIDVAKEQLDKLGITTTQREGYLPGVSELLHNRVNPRGYPHSLRDLIEQFSGNVEKINASSNDKIFSSISKKRDDAWRLYLGLPQKNKTFRIAEPMDIGSYFPHKKGSEVFSLNETPRITNPPQIGEYRVGSHAGVMGNYGQYSHPTNIEYYDYWNLEPKVTTGYRKIGSIERSLGKRSHVRIPKNITLPISKIIGKPFETRGTIPIEESINYTKQIKDLVLKHMKKGYKNGGWLDAYTD